MCLLALTNSILCPHNAAYMLIGKHRFFLWPGFHQQVVDTSLSSLRACLMASGLEFAYLQYYYVLKHQCIAVPGFACGLESLMQAAWQVPFPKSSLLGRSPRAAGACAADSSHSDGRSAPFVIVFRI